MDYLKFTLGFHDPLFADVLEAELAEGGFDSFDRANGSLIAYVPSETFDEAFVTHVLSEYSKEIFSTQRETIPHQNWNATWEADYKPVIIEGLMIRAPFHEIEPGIKEVITINPNMSFGTGHHPTTEQVLREMMDTNLSGTSFLDFGCGSGILCIYAALHGGSGIGIEIDPHAAEAARENLNLNGVSTFKILTGGIEQIADNRFDLIAANINRNVIEESLSQFMLALNPGGLIFCSGFLESDIPFLIEILKTRGLNIQKQSAQGGWGFISAKKPI